MKDLVMHLLKMGLAFLMGMLVIFILLWIPQALSAPTQETVPTREARSGEQDRSLNYRTPVLTTVERVYVDSPYVSTGGSCAESNRMRVEMLRQIAREIAAHPETAEVYRGAIQTIHDTWCVVGAQ